MKKNILYRIVSFGSLVVGVFFCNLINAADIIQLSDGNIQTLTICGYDSYSTTSGCITMMDRNLGATSNDVSSIDSYGNLYQWGNNYAFPNTGSVITGDTRINCSSYSFSNPLNYNVFVISTGDYCIQPNINLWGGDNCCGNSYPVTNVEQKKGPCPDNYHVPTIGEWHAVMNIWGDNDETYIGQHSYAFHYAFNIPFVGYREGYFDGSLDNEGLNGYGKLWSSTVQPNSNGARYVDLYYDYHLYTNTLNRNYGLSVRCFRNQSLIGTNDTGTNTTGSDLTGNIEVGISSLGLIIGTPNSVDLGSMPTNTTKTFTFTEPFWIKDLRGASRGHYTTIQLNGLYQVGGNGVITGVRLVAASGAVLSGGIANGTQINPSMISNNGVDITNPVLFFYRENGQNSSGVVNQYISMPLLRINTRGAPAGTYRGSIVYTLYDIGYED